MKISIYGRKFNESFLPYIHEILEKLHKQSVDIYIYKPFLDFIQKQHPESAIDIAHTYTGYENLPKDIDFMVSIGGDGTFLESIAFIRNHDIPVIGINSGRLGFLANISKETISEAFDAMFKRNFSFEQRSLIEVVTPKHLFNDFNFALNEVTIQRKGSSMISIHVYLNNEFLNTYWSDGLIISTPTGSTAYSISVGGPLVSPGCHNFIISPIAPHNLSVRPIVINDDYEITLRVEGRDDSFLITVDNRYNEISKPVEIKLRKAPFTLRMVKFESNNFYNTLRNKLMWGGDLRN